MSIESEFVRPALIFESEFGQYRNWWARDTRIGGNAFTILMYLLSHKQDFRITQSKAQVDLELGKDAFLAARRRLESAGFLKVHEYRFPAGSVTDDGRPVGGQRRFVFELLDPEPPPKLRRAHGGHSSSDRLADGFAAAEEPREQADRASEDNPPRLLDEPEDEALEVAAGSPHMFPGDDYDHDDLDVEPRSSQFPSEAHELGPKPKEENPTVGFPPLKEDQVKKTKSSSSDAGFTAEAASPSAVGQDDDDSWSEFGRGTESLLLELHSGLDLRRLLARLRRENPLLLLGTLDIELAASEVIAGAANRVGDPVAYVAKSILAEPWRWVKANLLAQPDPGRSEFGGLGPLGDCAARGHQWSGPWKEICLACDEFRSGWQNDRDREGYAS